MKRAYGECARSGKRVPLEQLVPDGELGGLLVARDWFEPKHPQEEAPKLRAARHRVPAPELSKPDDEGVAAPTISFDETGKLEFVVEGD